MLADGAAVDDVDVLGAPEVIAFDSPDASGGGASPVVAGTSLSAEGDGVDAAVSSAARRLSIRWSLRAEAAEREALVCASSDVAPVLALLCFGWSASEGERDRLRERSASGMVPSLVFFSAQARKGLLAGGVRKEEGLERARGW